MFPPREANEDVRSSHGETSSGNGEPSEWEKSEAERIGFLYCELLSYCHGIDVGKLSTPCRGPFPPNVSWWVTLAINSPAARGRLSICV